MQSHILFDFSKLQSTCFASYNAIKLFAEERKSEPKAFKAEKFVDTTMVTKTRILTIKKSYDEIVEAHILFGVALDSSITNSSDAKINKALKSCHSKFKRVFGLVDHQIMKKFKVIQDLKLLLRVYTEVVEKAIAIESTALIQLSACVILNRLIKDTFEEITKINLAQISNNSLKSVSRKRSVSRAKRCRGNIHGRYTDIEQTVQIGMDESSKNNSNQHLPIESYWSDQPSSIGPKNNFYNLPSSSRIGAVKPKDGLRFLHCKSSNILNNTDTDLDFFWNQDLSNGSKRNNDKVLITNMVDLRIKNELESFSEESLPFLTSSIKDDEIETFFSPLTLSNNGPGQMINSKKTCFLHERLLKNEPQKVEFIDDQLLSSELSFDPSENMMLSSMAESGSTSDNLFEVWGPEIKKEWTWHF